jgi:hypothetical protein
VQPQSRQASFVAACMFFIFILANYPQNRGPINNQEFYQGQKIKLTYAVPLPDQELVFRGVK